MIFVQEQPEPVRFDADVRRPGRRFLSQTNVPTTDDWRSRSYWRRVLAELHDAYMGVCAYTCHWIAYDTGSATVDHFVPKSVDKALAYEWCNYRLVCGRMNGRKGAHQDVLDPFRLPRNVFELDFPSLQIMPSMRHGNAFSEQAKSTIDRLGLNDETSVKTRLAYVRNYCASHISLEFLEHNAPFIYQEIVRQNIERDIRRVMSLE